MALGFYLRTLSFFIRFFPTASYVFIGQFPSQCLQRSWAAACSLEMIISNQR
jgi:hypothetical protein